MSALGFDILPGEHPIVPVMLGDAALATKMAERLLEKGVYVVGVFLSGRARRERRASACSSRRRIAAKIWSLPSRNSRRFERNSKSHSTAASASILTIQSKDRKGLPLSRTE